MYHFCFFVNFFSLSVSYCIYRRSIIVHSVYTLDWIMINATSASFHLLYYNNNSFGEATTRYRPMFTRNICLTKGISIIFPIIRTMTLSIPVSSSSRCFTSHSHRSPWTEIHCGVYRINCLNSNSRKFRCDIDGYDSRESPSAKFFGMDEGTMTFKVRQQRSTSRNCRLIDK